MLPVRSCTIRVITKLPNSEQSYKGKDKTHKWYNLITNVYTDMAAKASIEVSDNFSWT
jgi:hypothetical protein